MKWVIVTGFEIIILIVTRQPRKRRLQVAAQWAIPRLMGPLRCKACTEIFGFWRDWGARCFSQMRRHSIRDPCQRGSRNGTCRDAHRIWESQRGSTSRTGRLDMRGENLTMRRKVGSCRGRDSSTKLVVARHIINAQDRVRGNTTSIACKRIRPR